jgi:regulator of replication initiation timing
MTELYTSIDLLNEIARLKQELSEARTANTALQLGVERLIREMAEAQERYDEKMTAVVQTNDELATKLRKQRMKK